MRLFDKFIGKANAVEVCRVLTGPYDCETSALKRLVAFFVSPVLGSSDFLGLVINVIKLLRVHGGCLGVMRR